MTKETFGSTRRRSNNSSQILSVVMCHSIEMHCLLPRHPTLKLWLETVFCIQRRVRERRQVLKTQLMQKQVAVFILKNDLSNNEQAWTDGKTEKRKYCRSSMLKAMHNWVASMKSSFSDIKWFCYLKTGQMTSKTRIAVETNAVVRLWRWEIQLQAKEDSRRSSLKHMKQFWLPKMELLSMKEEKDLSSQQKFVCIAKRMKRTRRNHTTVAGHALHSLLLNQALKMLISELVTAPW